MYVHQLVYYKINDIQLSSQKGRYNKSYCPYAKERIWVNSCELVEEVK